MKQRIRDRKLTTARGVRTFYQKVRLPLVLAVTLLAVTVTIVKFQRSRQATAQLPVGEGPPTYRVNARMRAADDERLDRLSRESFEESIDKLDEDENYITMSTFHDTSGVVGDGYFVLATASRRTLKVLDTVQNMSESQRTEVCRVIFQRFMVQHREILEVVMRAEEDPLAPRNDRSMLGSCCALSSAIFLSAHFTDLETVIDQLGEVETFAAYVRRRMDEKSYLPISKANIYHYVEPAVPFKLSVLKHALTRDDSVAPAIKKSLNSVLDALPHTEVPLLAWNTRTAVSDRSNLISGAPIDPADIIMQLDNYRLSYSSWPKERVAELWSNVNRIIVQ